MPGLFCLHIGQKGVISPRKVEQKARSRPVNFGPYLGGAFNPSEKYACQIGSFHQVRVNIPRTTCSVTMHGKAVQPPTGSGHDEIASQVLA